MAAVEENFDYWLSLKLKDLKADESVFSAYIKGILAGEDSEDEKREALESILEGITSDISTHCQEILEKWLSSNNATPLLNTKPMEQLDNVDERLARLLETNVKSSSVQRSYTDEERKIRDAILSQYGQTSDYEDEFDQNEGDDKSKNKSKENGLEKNMNALAIHLAEKEKRERLREESKKKKEKDKEDKEKQKQLVQEKKEKRKTHAQKGERRR